MKPKQQSEKKCYTLKENCPKKYDLESGFDTCFSMDCKARTGKQGKPQEVKSEVDKKIKEIVDTFINTTENKYWLESRIKLLTQQVIGEERKEIIERLELLHDHEFDIEKVVEIINK